MPTWNELQQMSDAEVKELNNKLAKRLVIKLATTAAVTVAFHVGAYYISKKLFS